MSAPACFRPVGRGRACPRACDLLRRAGAGKFRAGRVEARCEVC